MKERYEVEARFVTLAAASTMSDMSPCQTCHHVCSMLMQTESLAPFCTMPCHATPARVVSPQLACSCPALHAHFI